MEPQLSLDRLMMNLLDINLGNALLSLSIKELYKIKSNQLFVFAIMAVCLYHLPVSDVLYIGSGR